VTQSRWSFPAEWLVFTVIVVDLVGFGILIPILPFMSPLLGGNEIDVALVIAIYSLGAGIVGPFWGALSDRIGRKRVLMICLFGGALSYLLLGAATELWMLYAARGFGGLMAGSLPVASALMADVSAPERRAKAMGLVGSAFGLGLILGPVIGGLLAGPGDSFFLPGVFAAAMSFLSVLLAGVLLPSEAPSALTRATAGKSRPKIGLVSFLRERHAMLLVSQYALHTAAVSSAIYLSPLWLAAFQNWGPREIGILFGLVGVAMIVIQGASIDWLTRRFGLLNVLGAGSFVFVSSLVATLFVDSELSRALVVFTAFTGATCCLPVLNTIASSVVIPSERGRMMGATALTASIGRVAGPLVTGAVLVMTNYALAWLFVALPVVGLLLWSRTAAKRYRKPDGLMPSDSGA